MGLGQKSDEAKASALIIAIEDYSRHPKLENLTASANDLAKVLGQVCLVDLPSGKIASSDLEKKIKSWFEQATSEDRLVMFWTGHGERESSRLYLMTHDSPTFKFDSTNAVEPGFIAKCAAFCKAQKILLFIDACHSGTAVSDIIAEIANVMKEQSPDVMKRRGIEVIASAHAIEKADANVVCRVFKEALIDNSFPRRWTDSDCYIDGDWFTDALMDEVERRGIEQHLVPATYGRVTYLIPNPRFRANMPPENVEERGWRLSQSDSAEHFELAARGIEVGETGWFFCGRKRLLRELVNWLNTADTGVRIVTGPPGTGKSAVVGRLATLSDPEYRQEAIKVEAVMEGADPVPPVGAIDVAVHAKGKTLDDCARALAKGLHIELGQKVPVDVDLLVAEIGKLGRKVTLVIDAIDEAASGQGEAIASRLIVQLGRLPQVKLLVGSRRSLDGAVIPEAEERHGRLRAAFGSNVVIDDLADEKDTREDIADYVRRRLASSDKHRNDDPAILQQSAERVAGKAEGVFLYARIVSRTLQEQDRLDGSLPEGTLDAFEQDIKDRFKGEERRVDDLLDALAWGEGKGLTRRVWPLVANALAARDPPYDDDDVVWVLGHAGWYIIEAGEDGQTVYRLSHQALADHYRAKLNEKEAQGRIVAALTRGLAGADWLDCDHYIWRCLADHAAKADRLDDLIQDPGYLAVAETSRLVSLLPDVERETSRRFADLYDLVVDRLVRETAIGRFPLLHLTAQVDAPDLARRFEPPVATLWRCRWARVRQSAPNRVIGRHSRSVLSVAIGTIGDRVIVASGGDDRTVRLWDAITGSAIGEPLRGHYGWVTSVALGIAGDRAIVVSGSEDQTVRVWDIAAGKCLCVLEHRGPVTSVAFGDVDGRPVIVSGGRNGIICRWDALSQTSFGDPIEAHHGAVCDVAFNIVDAIPIVASGGSDGLVRLWDARTGRPFGVPMDTHSEVVHSVTIGVVDDRPIAIFGGQKGTIGFFDVRLGKPFGEWLQGRPFALAAVGRVEGRAVVAYPGRDRTIRMCDAGSRSPFGDPLRGHSASIDSIAFGGIGDRAVIISGSGDRTVRLWDIRKWKSRGDDGAEHNASVNAVAFYEVGGGPVVVTGSWDRTVRRWDAESGEEVGEPFRHSSGVNALAVGVVGGRTIITSGCQDGSIMRWDAQSNELIGEPLRGHNRAVLALSMGNIDDHSVVISGGDDRTLRCWDARSGKLTKVLKKAHNGVVTALMLGTVDGRAIIVSGSHDKTICVRDGRTWALIGKASRRRTARITSLALGAGNRELVIVSGGRDKLIHFTDPKTGESMGQPLAGHTETVTSVGVITLAGSDVVVSGGLDGTVRLWNLQTATTLRVIDIGTPIEALAIRLGCGIAVATVRGVLLLEIDLLAA